MSVVSTHENITKNPERTIRSRDVHSDEARKADGFTSAGEVQDVLRWGQNESSSGKDDLNVREGGDLGAIDGGFSVRGRDQGANLKLVSRVNFN